ncbi:hypothetical protein OS190_12625 [Sulfitobacter sp. F26204]|uniref:hypothetical protein n=1 Tax=Sulfitobacter sp. F26204 TaxID=2996014 RepID=UPI00225E51F7|nr:hypothetical protein [Sulfitobacter sp. F26204]MCX7560414.1 hypothetical protein [Sulfitobacter sp. F26204]
MEDNFKLGVGIGLVLTVSLATALHATTATPAVRNADNSARALHLSKEAILAQFVVPDQVVPDPEPVDNITGEDDEPGEGPSDTGAAAGVSTASTSATNAILSQLEKGADLCEKTPGAYEIDCLSLNYRETAKKLAERGDYGEARTVLLDTADQLDALVQSNRDSTKPRIQVKDKSNGRKLHKRALTPVKPQSLARVKRQAIPILEEASTKLLRSASSSSTKSVHYQRIAAAVSSNKVLLRSS